MRQSTKNRIRNLVITEKVTKFVAKVFLMTTISDFKNGDIATPIIVMTTATDRYAFL